LRRLVKRKPRQTAWELTSSPTYGFTSRKVGLDDMGDPEELRALAAWKVHTLTGDRKGTWSLSVTRNRRLTFRIDTAERGICDVDLEDYH